MSSLPDPPDLEPGEDRVTELSSVIPPPADEFAEAVHARLDRESLATNLAALGWSAIVEGFLQIFGALFSFLGADPLNDRRPEDEHE